MPSSTKTGEFGHPATFGQGSSKSPRILAADDQQHILEAIELLLKPQGYAVDLVRSPELARDALASSSYDAVLIDLNYTRDTTSGREGLDLLSDIVTVDSTLPVIVMTAWGNVDVAVEAMRRGARDLFRSRGRTSGCLPFCEPRLSFTARFNGPSAWRQRIAC